MPSIQTLLNAKTITKEQHPFLTCSGYEFCNSLPGMESDVRGLAVSRRSAYNARAPAQTAELADRALGSTTCRTPYGDDEYPIHNVVPDEKDDRNLFDVSPTYYCRLNIRTELSCMVWALHRCGTVDTPITVNAHYGYRGVSIVLHGDGYSLDLFARNLHPNAHMHGSSTNNQLNHLLIRYDL